MNDTATAEVVNVDALKRLGNADLHYSSSVLYRFNGRTPVHAMGGVAYTLQKILSLRNSPQRIDLSFQRITDAHGEISLGRIKRLQFDCPASIVDMISSRARTQGLTLEDAQVQMVRTILETLHKGNTKAIHLFGVSIQCL